MKLCLSWFFIILIGYNFAQQDSVLYNREITLKTSLDKLRNASSDLEKDKLNSEFKILLEETLKLKGVFDYPFALLKTLGTIKSPDNSFRLFNWNVELEDKSNLYYCYVLKYDEKKKKYNVIELIDKTDIRLVENQILDEDNWYGCLYYKIIPINKNGKKTFTLLGWDGNYAISNIKLIDALSFQGEHIKFGQAIFKVKNSTQKRLYYEYSKRAFMSLNYDEAGKRIVMDHLSPETPSLEGFREFYVPDFSYDDLVFQNNKWHLREDVIGINKGSNKKSNTIQYAKINKDGEQVELITKEVKDKWIDPSDAKNPSGASLHVAQVPDYVVEDKENYVKQQKSEKTGRKRYRKNEFSMNPYLKRVREKK